MTLQSAEEIVKAYELVGSIRPELLKNSQALANVTKQAIILSEATGGKLGLEASAKALTSTLNQFNLSSSQSARVINALAAGSKFGSATADLLSESFKNSGAVLADANVTVEQAIALTEVLAEKQIVGTEAGTKLRGSVLKLQQAGVGYVSGQFNINDALEEANQLLEEQETQAQRDKLAIKLFGAENITTGKILLNNVETFEKLTEQVTGTTTALEQQETQNDNLASSWVKLTNTIESSLLTGTGLLNSFVKTLRDAVLEIQNLDLIFGRVSKFSEEQIQRNFDFLQQLSTKTGRAFRELIAQFQGLSEAELIAQKDLFFETAKEAGFNRKSREQLYDEFLKRRLEQIEAERLADAEAQEAARLKAEEEEKKRLESEAAAQKKRESNIKKIQSLDNEIAKFLKDSTTELEVFEDTLEDIFNDLSDEIIDLSKESQTNFKQLNEDAKTFAQLQFETSKKTFEDQLEFIKTKRDAELLNQELTENQRKLIITKSENEITALTEQQEAQRTQILQNRIQTSQTILNGAAQAVNNLQQAQLIAAEGNAEEQKKIQKKYADIQFAITAGQIVADTSAAIVATWKGFAGLGPVGTGLAIAQTSVIGAVGLTELLVANAERQRIQSLGVGGFVGNDGVIVGDRHTDKSGGVPLTSIMTEGDEAASIYNRKATSQHKSDIYTFWDAVNNKGGNVDMAKFNSVKFNNAPKNDNKIIEMLLSKILLKGESNYLVINNKVVQINPDGSYSITPSQKYTN